jgi:hypothetical protein
MGKAYVMKKKLSSLQPLISAFILNLWPEILSA